VAGKIKSYVGAVEYDGEGKISRIGTEEGYILKRTGWNENSKDSKFVYYYSVKDHLGNVRLVLDDESNAKLWQRNDYQAFGMHINQPVDGVPLPDLIGINDRYYNGKEFDDQTTWLDYGARQYDYSLGRWMAVDPLADHPQQLRFSPYVFSNNNPLRFIDPDGRLPGDIYNQSGTHIGNDGQDDNRVYVANTTSNTQLSQDQSKNLVTVHDFVGTWGNKEGGGGLTEVKTGDNINVLSRIIYAEAAGENNASKEAVGDVMKNRVDSGKYPDSYQDVAEQHSAKGTYQFSSANPNREESWRYTDPNNPDKQNLTEKKSYQNSISAAIKVYNRESKGAGDITGGANIYYSPKSMVPANSQPSWDFSKLTPVSVSGVGANNFKFYKTK
jgi:RHS repeat-associated protein